VVAFDDLLVPWGIEDAAVRTGQRAKETLNAFPIVDRNDSCHRIFGNRSGGADAPAVRLAALEADDRTVVIRLEVLNCPDSRTGGVLLSCLDPGACLLAFSTVVALFRV
jgi:hypothetical protein